MKFNFDNLIIWLKKGNIRTLKFLPNKVNIITGNSNTGKTAILDIIDYCLFASRHKISDSIINENVEWYGIRFSINDKCYTVARKAPFKTIVSPDYYFSSTGKIPEKFPHSNITESALKTSLETDFDINHDIKISYGGRVIKANSRISLRYFLLFNTISQDIITHSEEFFDKQKDEKYREALPRTFDLAVGIDNVENILKREKRDEIERELRKLEREDKKLNQKQDAFYTQLAEIVKTAKEFALIPENSNIDDAVSELKKLIAQVDTAIRADIPEKYDSVSQEINIVIRKIRNLKRFSKEYKNYKENLKDTSDSLKPIEFMVEKYSDILKTSIYDEIIASLKEDYIMIKKYIYGKNPMDSNISDIINRYEKRLEELRGEIALLPKEIKSFENDKKKYMFIGEIKAKLSLYEKDQDKEDSSKSAKIEQLKNMLDDLDAELVENRRLLFIKALDETIQDYINFTKSALENYGEYRASFNYKDKSLQLRKPKTDFVENIGSSSNHMFLHLFLFLGLHEIIAKRNIRYVPPFLIIDQFSRPYWGEGESRKEKLDHLDIFKVKTALKLMNYFITCISNSGKEFQMIVFEHINHDLWDDLENVHLVEEFRDGNALIPLSMLSS
ncbi:DUF3732 domain-containing protein [Nitrosomonas sp. Nm34]|uniref:DUF3732 domain-containing protein n=1 Tax=Nitrosomonas sp. Nm34 TaxID=1881055 RepID=UPI0008E53C5F|nr:DUF3732 domain-containing protein [Nitrosomonas sp. Nm34]SFI36759.1 AAA domain-containing protein [Nitrosomonas sp. Nm34]